MDPAGGGKNKNTLPKLASEEEIGVIDRNSIRAKPPVAGKNTICIQYKRFAEKYQGYNYINMNPLDRAQSVLVAATTSPDLNPNCRGCRDNLP